jgi:hypothetical protein
MICRTLGIIPIAIRKLRGLKVGGIQREGKKNTFCKLKAYFSWYFFITPFPLHFKDDF